MMPVRSKALFFFLFFFFVLNVIPLASAGDLKVVSVFRTEKGDPYTSTRYYKGERLRIEFQDRASWKPGLVTYGPPGADIYQCDAQRYIRLDLESRKYAITPLDDGCRSKNAAPLSPQKGKIDVYIERTDTGERREILGRAARHIITHQRQVAGPGACWSDAKTEWDGWYIDMAERDVDRRLRGNTVDRSARVIFTGANCRDKIEVHRTGVERPGFALKMVYTSWVPVRKQDGTSTEFTNRWETEVTELSEAPLDPALFEVPAGFTKVSEIKASPSMPFSVAVEYWWQRTVNEVKSWF